MNTSRDFRIRFDVICENDFVKTAKWRESSCAKTMAAIINRYEEVHVLFEDFLAREPFADKDSIRTYKTYLTSNNRAEMRRTLLNDAFLAPDNFYYIEPGGYVGVNLYCNTEIPSSHKDFPLLFAFRLSKTDHIQDFLDYHSKTFAKNYEVFLTEVMSVHSGILGNRVDIVKSWIDQRQQKVKARERYPIPEDLSETIREAVKAELGSLKNNESETLLQREDVAKLLDVNLSTVHAWMNEGRLPFHKMGRRVYFRKDEVLAAMKRKRE